MKKNYENINNLAYTLRLTVYLYESLSASVRIRTPGYDCHAVDETAPAIDTHIHVRDGLLHGSHSRAFFVRESKAGRSELTEHIAYKKAQ